MYDPQVGEKQIWMDLEEGGYDLDFHKKKVTINKTALEACDGAAAIVIATEWDEFKTLDWQAVYDKMSKPAFVVRFFFILACCTARRISF